MNSREWAIITWFSIIILWCLLSNNLRQTVLNFIKSIFRLVTEPVFCLIIAYQIIIITGIFLFIMKYNLTFWIVKDYCIVFFTTVIIFLGESQSKNFLLALFNSVGMGALFQFFISTYTFSYWTELFLIFAIAFLLLVIAVSKSQSSILGKIFDHILLATYAVILVFVVVHLYQDIFDMWNLNYWMEYFVEPISWLVNFPLIMIAIPLYQYDRLDNIRTIRKTPFSLFKHTFLFELGLVLNSWLKFTHIRRLIVNVQQGGAYQAKLQIYIKDNVTYRQVKQIKTIYKYMLAPAKDFKNKKKIIPIRIECRYESTRQLIDIPYEISNLKRMYK